MVQQAPSSSQSKPAPLKPIVTIVVAAAQGTVAVWIVVDETRTIRASYNETLLFTRGKTYDTFEVSKLNTLTEEQVDFLARNSRIAVTETVIPSLNALPGTKSQQL